MVKLSEEQRQALDAQQGVPLRLLDERTGAAYVLIRAELYEQLQTALTADEFDVQQAYPLMDEVASKEGWDDPEMDSYDTYARQGRP